MKLVDVDPRYSFEPTAEGKYRVLDDWEAQRRERLPVFDTETEARAYVERANRLEAVQTLGRCPGSLRKARRKLGATVCAVCGTEVPLTEYRRVAVVHPNREKS